MKSAIRHLESHLRKQAREGRGWLNTSSSLSGEHSHLSTLGRIVPAPGVRWTCGEQVDEARKEGRGCKDGLGGQDEGKEAGEDQEAGAGYSTLCPYWQDLKILLEVSWIREQAWELPKPNSGCGCAVNAQWAGGPGVFPGKAASFRGCTQPRDGSNNSS